MKIIEGKPVLVPINKIRRDPKQPRLSFPEKKIEGMAQSIKNHGIINPIEIDKDYTIVTGELRFRAVKSLGWKEIPCRIIEIDSQTRFERQVVENIHNSNMTAYETAEAFTKLLATLPGNLARGKFHQGERYQLGVKELSERIGISHTTIWDYLRILRVSKPLQKAIKEERIPFTMLRELEKAPEQFQKRLEKKIVKEEFASRDMVLEVASALNRAPGKAKEILAIDYSPFKSTAEVIERVRQFAPTIDRVEELRKTWDAPEQLSDIKAQLDKWLKENTRESIGRYHFGRVALNLQFMIRNIQKWAVKEEEPLQIKDN